jgi:YVTN family beta-propeller protein
MSYQVDVGYKYLEQLPSAAVSNKIIGTYPRATNIGPSASVTALGNIYITNFNSNTVSVISETTMHLIKTVYAGKEPDAIAFDWKNSMLYVADYYGYTLPSGYNYSTITEINATNNSYVGTINSNGADHYLYGPTSIVYDPVANSIFTSDYYFSTYYNYFIGSSGITQYNISTNSLKDTTSYKFYNNYLFDNNNYFYVSYPPFFQGIAYDYELNELVLIDTFNNGYWLFNPGQNTASFQPIRNQDYSPYAVGLSNNTADIALFSSTFYSGSNYILAYNLITGKEIGSPLLISNNGAPQNITYSMATGEWYVGVTGAVNQVDVISVSVTPTPGVSLVGSINVGPNPYNVGIITDGTFFVDYVYSVNFGSNDESVINPSSNNVVYTVWNNYLN